MGGDALPDAMAVRDTWHTMSVDASGFLCQKDGRAQREVRMSRGYYILDDGTVVKIPTQPIKRAGYSLPGWIVKPDGKRIYVMELNDGEEPPESPAKV